MRRGRTGPSVDEIFPINEDGPIQTDEMLHSIAEKKGFTVEYSDEPNKSDAILMNFSMKELTIIVLFFIMFLKMSLVPALNVFMSGYGGDADVSLSNTGADIPASFSTQQRATSTCDSSVHESQEFKGANILLLGGGSVAQEIMLQLASSTHLAANGGDINVMGVFDSSGGVALGKPMTSRALRSIVRGKRSGFSISSLIQKADDKSKKASPGDLLLAEPRPYENLQSLIGEMLSAPTSSSSSSSSSLSSSSSSSSSSHTSTSSSPSSPSYASLPCSSLLIVVDATADSTEKHAMELGRLLKNLPCSRLVLANKAPVSSVTSEDVAELAFSPVAAREPRRVYYEATVGAGLPVIRTLQSLADVGDSVMKVEAILSGTLSYVLSDMARDMAEDMVEDMAEDKVEDKAEDKAEDKEEDKHLYSKGMLVSMKRAMKLGLTEPNPCMDTSGLDVARKGLILGRLISEDANSLSVDDVVLESMSNECKYHTVDADTNHDDESVESVESVAGSKLKVVNVFHIEDAMEVERKVEASVRDGSTLRYVAIIEAHGTTSSKRVKVRVGLKKYDTNHPFGGGGGGGASPENVIVVHTSMYNENPLVIRGPGAGAALTASAVLSDVLRCVFEQ